MPHGRRHLGCGEHEAAVAADRDDRHIGPRMLRAERGGKAPAQRILKAGRDIGARLVDRERPPRGENHLRDVFDENAVFGQFGADRFEKGDLRRDLSPTASATLPAALPSRPCAKRALTLCAGNSASRLCRIGLASPVSATAGLCRRSCSFGSASMRTICRSRSMPHWRNWIRSRVPTASTTSASPHRSRPSGNVTLNGSRPSSTPRPRRNASTGACSIAESAVTSADESCAPPPQMIIGRLAAPSSFAALRTASRSILAAGIGQRLLHRYRAGLAPDIHGAFEHGRSGTAGAHGAQRAAPSPAKLVPACGSARYDRPGVRRCRPGRGSRGGGRDPRPISASGICPTRPSTGAFMA